MRGLDKPTARYLILSITGAYIPLLACLELGSLALGTVVGFYITFRPRQN